MGWPADKEAVVDAPCNEPDAGGCSLGGTHDIGCVVMLRGLQVRPISTDLRAGTGGNLIVEWGAPSLGTSRAAGGVVSLATAAPSSLPPTSTAAGQSEPPDIPMMVFALAALLGAVWAVRRRCPMMH